MRDVGVNFFFFTFSDGKYFCIQPGANSNQSLFYPSEHVTEAETLK